MGVRHGGRTSKIRARVCLIGCIRLAEREVNFRYESLHDSHILEP